MERLGPRIKTNLVSVYVIRNAPAGAASPIELLLLQRPDDHAFPGDWQAVHGHIQREEPAWQAALREQHEETGLPVLHWYRLAEVESFYSPHNDSLYFVPAFVASVPPHAQPILSHEHQACAWRTLDQAISMFSWQTQRRTVDTLRQATRHWPTLGAALMPMDIDALRRGAPDPPPDPTE